MRREAFEAAENGTEAYRTFFASLIKAHQKRLIDTDHENLKSVAQQADDDARTAAEAEDEYHGEDDEAA